MREAVVVAASHVPLTQAHRGEFNITSGPAPALTEGKRRGAENHHRQAFIGRDKEMSA